jgi:hypothetical protein
VVNAVAGKFILNKVDSVFAAVSLSTSIKLTVANTLALCELYNRIDLTILIVFAGAVYNTVLVVLANTKVFDKNKSANEPVPC